MFSVCSRIHEKLMVHSDVRKAESWTGLTEEFLNSPLPNTEGTKVCRSPAADPEGGL